MKTGEKIDLTNPCAHVTRELIQTVHRPPPGCEDCLKIGGQWVHLGLSTGPARHQSFSA